MASFDGLLLNARTRTTATAFAVQPPQAMMIVGLPGSGKTALARALAAEILKTERISDYPYFLHITTPEDKKVIPIDSIREVLHKLRLKTPGKEGIRRIVFIEDAHSLNDEAQNALLKALEEPAEDTAFILSVRSEKGVLPTIASRAQALNVQPATLAQAETFYKDSYPLDQIKSAWQLSQGRSGLLGALLMNSAEHPLKQAVDAAKQLLRQDRYQRLIQLDKLSKDKEQFSLLMDGLSKVLAALQRINLAKGQNQARLLNSRRLVAQLQSALAANAAPRLVALELALKLEV